MTEAEGALVNRLLTQLSDKARRNNLRLAYYDGRRAALQLGAVVPPQYYRMGLVLGWSAKAVDVLARRCNLDGIVWPDGDINSLGLAEFNDANAFYAEASSAFVSSLVLGVVFSITTGGAPGEPKALVHFKDALNATGDWNGRTRRMANLLSVTSRDGDGRPDGLALYLDGQTVTSSKQNGRWSTAERTFHGYGVPVEALPFRPNVNRPLGRSRISRTVMSLHDQGLRTVIRMEGHLDVYSFPELWMLGADSSVFKNADGTVKPVWQTMIARIKGIPDDMRPGVPNHLARADVKQFPAASPEPHLAALRQQAQLFAGETSLTLESLGVSNKANPTSAESYIASREDLIAEAEGATDDWTPPLRRTVARALAIQNGERTVPKSYLTMEPKFRSPVHISRAAQADAGQKQIAAVPWLAETTVGLQLLGLSGPSKTVNAPCPRAISRWNRNSVLPYISRGLRKLMPAKSRSRQCRGLPRRRSGCSCSDCR
ncbi:phage portal protein, partial [Mycolicibacterium iranicum]